MTDVLVIGAGPAALATALSASAQGLSVRVVGRQRPARQQVETLHGRVPMWLQTLHCGDLLSSVSRGTWSSPAGPAHHVLRSEFDAALRQRVLARGVSMLDEQVAQVLVEGQRPVGVVLASGETERARWCVDGSGRARVVARALGLAVRTDSGPMKAWRGLSDEPGETRFERTEGGWRFEVPFDGGVAWTELGAIRPEGALAGFDVSWSRVRPCAGRGYLLVGDAAATVDPASGQGVMTALWSGCVASAVLARIKRQPNMEPWLLATYDGWQAERYAERIGPLGAYYAA